MRNEEERMLRELYPDREKFSKSEIDVVRRVIDSNAGARKIPGRCASVPYVFIPIGGRIKVGGRIYECVKAGATILPSQACSGCALRTGRVQCMKYQCSPFDRRDGKFTWFVEVRDAE